MYHRIALLLALLATLLAGCSTVDPAEEAKAANAERERLLAEADAAREDHRHAEERELYEEMISNDEKDARAHFRRGTTFMREAQAVDLDHDPEGRSRLYRKAIEDFDVAIKLKPNLYASAYFCRGECNFALMGLEPNPVTSGKYLKRAMRDQLVVTQINRLHPYANRRLAEILHYEIDGDEAKRKAIFYYRQHIKAVGSDSVVQLQLDKLIRRYGDPDLNLPKPKPTPEGGEPGKADAPGKGAGKSADPASRGAGSGDVPPLPGD